MDFERIFANIMMCMGIGIVVNAIIASILSNVNTGIILTYFLGIAIFLYGKFFIKFIQNISRFINYMCLGFIFIIVVGISFLFLYGKVDNVTYKEDVVIVLGASIHGEQPSESLKSRLNRTIDYYSKNPDVMIIVTGGKGTQEDITESLAMARYLVAHGIPSDKILKEECATSTKENFKYSKQLLDENVEDIAFITNDYHIYRAKQIAKSVGMGQVTHCYGKTPWYMVIPSGLRECLAVAKFWIEEIVHLPILILF